MTRLIWETACLAIVFSLEEWFPYFPRRTRRIPHALKNISMAGINGFLVSIPASWVTVQVMEWSQKNSFGLFNHGFLNSPLKSLCLFVCFDAWMYLWHRANHQMPFLWRFHRVHHSDLELDSTSAFRFHVGEIFFSSLFRLPVIAILNMQWIHLFIYELCLQPVIIFHHSNIALPEKWDRILRSLIVTPNMHRVHHSIETFETNSNYSSIFSFWDRIAKSFEKRADTRTLKYGLPEFQESEWQSLPGLLKTPFVSPAPKNP